ncbi:SRPBCC family protein [Streptomyces sp. TP-A0874]|uniref:SRPBCC family protein n=1 Tax=Streptomyces sp. TP-A0874 TaxID=549819 RepID=UPI0008535374|nr:SRPBCC family protein [Streptomyces sp. TP-A0874]
MTRMFSFGPPLGELRRDYALRGRTDPDAPVRAAAEERIDAPVERVWELLAGLSGWPAWNPSIKSVAVVGEESADGPTATPVACGTGFTWVNNGMRIRSQIAVAEPCRELSWTGVTLGIRAVHRNTFEELPDGGTMVRSEESMSAPLLALLFSSGKLERELSTLLGRLKAAAEREETSG